MKDEQIEVLIDWFDDLKSKYCIDIKYIHCVNAGENKALQSQLKKARSKIQFEFTAPDTPQQNGIGECSFSTLMGHTRAMMNYAGFNKNMQQLMWCKSANTATALDGITVPSHENMCSYELFYGKTSCYMGSLHTFGEIAVIKDPVNISYKLDLCRIVCMFLRYSEAIHKKCTCS